MTIEEFEAETRDAIEQVLNQLNAATLLVAQVEAQIAEAGQTIQSLSRSIEAFVDQQKGAEADP